MMRKILFVDDEQFVLDSLGRLLREFRDRWQLYFATSGDAALEVTAQENPDLIISDIRMPGMTGLELLEKLQQNKKSRNIPVVILTGDHERSLKRKALKLGAMDLLNKPVTKEDLVARIENVLRIKEYRDIILKKNQDLEHQLVISQKMELVGIMAAGAFHDLSNMLSIIIGYSNLIKEDTDPSSKEAQTVDRICATGEKAYEVVNHILRFTRSTEIQSMVDIAGIIEEILLLLEVSIPKNIRINWTKPDAQFQSKGDPIKFQQVIMNLCINAVQAIGLDGGTVTLRLLGCRADCFCLEVEDDGPGIPEEILTQIFSPLFTTKTDGSGTGLGLFVVKRIIDEYNGSIEVDSKIGRGTVFHITLPYK